MTVAEVKSDSDRLNALIEYEPSDDDVWTPIPNRAARRRFISQWGQHLRSRRRRTFRRPRTGGFSPTRMARGKFDRKPLPVLAFLKGE
ncbi:hypothetical protein A5747_13485 [Mycobacterium sp. IS-836]|uniref:hypothetical protein n=1 Tax=Mycobacterium sp. IS-836 TaxID=1834160 RepID=UPI00096F6F3A|nr:hypothetical protein [Mycobacterium sp. IS-836]OMC55400.1 hypothetical protein A5747_13485 [Mycobacterium sp. IS-836]